MGRGLRIVVAVVVGLIVLAIGGQLIGPASILLGLLAAWATWVLTKPRTTS